MVSFKTLGCSALIALGLAGNAPVVAASQQAAQPTLSEHARYPVLLVSIDGLSPDTLVSADKFGLKIPVLRQFFADSAFAQRVINVNPTVTNPNHTTLVTGVAPRVHGIYNNRPFVAAAKLPKSYSDFADIQVETLWGAAKKANLKTASFYWPVTQKADPIDYNFLGKNAYNDSAIASEVVSTIEAEKPEFMTVHFVTHDGGQHAHGPNSAEGFAALEAIDTALGRVIAAQRQAHPNTVIAIASDHGFYAYSQYVHLNAAFVKAGLIKLRKDKENQLQVAEWTAFAWYVGGMAQVVLKDPKNAKDRQKVERFLNKLAANPESGVSHIHGPDVLKNGTLSTQTQYVIALKTGYRMGNEMEGPLLTPVKGGAHGAYTSATERTEMHSAFMIQAPGIQAGQNLGVIDMRQIAPTLAKYMKLSLPQAEKPPLPIQPASK